MNLPMLSFLVRAEVGELPSGPGDACALLHAAVNEQFVLTISEFHNGPTVGLGIRIAGWGRVVR